MIWGLKFLFQGVRGKRTGEASEKEGGDRECIIIEGRQEGRMEDKAIGEERRGKIRLRE